MRIAFGIMLMTLLVSGCSTPFIYDHPSAFTNINDSQETAALASVKDDRSSRVIDKIYEENPIRDVDLILKEELMSTGLFKEVFSVGHGDSNGSVNADLLVVPTLLHMNWKVPNYEQICSTAFFVGFFTGLVGGAIYGCTGADVHGDTILHIKTIDSETGEILIDKKYSGHCKFEKTKFTCDTLTTKATSVGESLEAAIEMFKADLIKSLSGRKADSVSSLNVAIPVDP